MHMLASVLQASIAQHRARKQSGLEEDLKTVADPEHGAAAVRKGAYLAHDRREARHRPGPQVVAVRKATGQNHDVRTLQIGVLVPEVLRVLTEHIPGRVKRVPVAVAARKDGDAESHLRLLAGVTGPCRRSRAARSRSSADTPPAARNDPSHARRPALKSPDGSFFRHTGPRRHPARWPA